MLFCVQLWPPGRTGGGDSCFPGWEPLSGLPIPTGLNGRADSHLKGSDRGQEAARCPVTGAPQGAFLGSLSPRHQGASFCLPPAWPCPEHPVNGPRRHTVGWHGLPPYSYRPHVPNLTLIRRLIMPFQWLRRASCVSRVSSPRDKRHGSADMAE